jgi:hypothetical protein
MSGEDNGVVLSNFLSVTGLEDESLGLGFLEAANWNLESAIEKYFSVISQDTSASTTNSTSATPLYEEEQVREPIATTVDILSEDPRGEQYLQLRNDRRNRGFHPKTTTAVFDVLRDFKQEEKYLEESSSTS